MFSSNQNQLPRYFTWWFYLLVSVIIDWRLALLRKLPQKKLSDIKPSFWWMTHRYILKIYFHFIFKMEMMSDLKMTNKNEDQCKCYTSKCFIDIDEIMCLFVYFLMMDTCFIILSENINVNSFSLQGTMIWWLRVVSIRCMTMIYHPEPVWPAPQVLV